MQGRAAFATGEYSRAIDFFHRAYSLVPAPTLAVYEGRALESLGKLVEASEAYMRASQTRLDPKAPEQFANAVHEADEERAKLQARIPSLLIDVEGVKADDPNLTVTMDGIAVDRVLIGVDRSVNPGSHHVIAGLDGGPATEATIAVSEGKHERVELRVLAVKQEVQTPSVTQTANRIGADAQGGSEPAHRRAAFPQKTLGYVALGVGAAGVGVGIVAGILATSEHATAARECPAGRCAGSMDAVEAFRSLRTASTIGYAVGAAGVIGGVTLLLTAPHSRETTAVSIAPTGVAFWERF